jgi:hypothetical protein
MEDTLINFLLLNKIKRSELNLIRLLMNDRYTITQLSKVFHWYQLKSSLEKLGKLNIIIKSEGKLLANKDNHFIKLLLKEMK